MSAQSFDPARYKAAQRQDWDAAAAGWKKWWATYEKGAGHVSAHMVDRAGLRPGHRVLDIATGVGEPAVTAARMVGPSGTVVATDHSPGMLEIGRQRIAAENLKNVEFHVGDAESLDFPEGSFDAALCRFGLMFIPDLAVALQRVYRSLLPGGKFVATVWADPARVPLASVVFGVLQKMLDLPSPPPGTPSLFGLGAPGVLEQAFKATGFRDVETEEITVTMDLPSAGGFVEFMQDTAAPIRAMVERHPDRAEAIWQAVGAAISQYSRPDGTISVPSVAICGTGTR